MKIALKIILIWLLLVFSFFTYNKETKRQVKNGSISETVNIDGAGLVAVGFAIAAIYSIWQFNRGFGRVAARLGLPAKLPSVVYSYLPLLLAPFLVVSYADSLTSPTDKGTITITTGYGDSSGKDWLFILLILLVYIAMLRKRLTQIELKLSR